MYGTVGGMVALKPCTGDMVIAQLNCLMSLGMDPLQDLSGDLEHLQMRIF